MELKYRTNLGEAMKAKGINRTFMELKWMCSHGCEGWWKEYQSNLYGIEMWLSELRPSRMPGINRTFMELKSVSFHDGLAANTRINRTFMELKLGRTMDTNAIRPRINRTFMELKCRWDSCKGQVKMVSIEPLWNWNDDHVSVNLQQFFTLLYS